MLSFAPVLAGNPARPATQCARCGDHVPFFDFAAEQGHAFVAVKCDYSKLPSLREGPATLEARLGAMAPLFGAARVLVWLPLESSTPASACFIDESDVFEYGCAAYQDRLAAVFAWMAEHYADALQGATFETAEARAADERDYLEGGGFPGELAVFFVPEEAPALSRIDALGREASAVMAGTVSVIVPEYGLMQDFCEGELEAGNGMRFSCAEDAEADEAG